jgi:hypothetical protein
MGFEAMEHLTIEHQVARCISTRFGPDAPLPKVKGGLGNNRGFPLISMFELLSMQNKLTNEWLKRKSSIGPRNQNIRLPKIVKSFFYQAELLTTS